MALLKGDFMSTHFKPERLLVPDPATDHIFGPLPAPVTLVEYGDFECPVCIQAYAAVQLLIINFGANLRFVFRHFPLRDVHPHAEMAAEASEAAGAQGKFWQMHDLLFTHSPHLKEKHLLDYAGQLGLDVPRYQNETRDQVYLQRVQEHMQGGRHLGVRTTPAFYVNGRWVEAAPGLKKVNEAVNAALNRH